MTIYNCLAPLILAKRNLMVKGNAGSIYYIPAQSAREITALDLRKLADEWRACDRTSSAFIADLSQPTGGEEKWNKGQEEREKNQMKNRDQLVSLILFGHQLVRLPVSLQNHTRVSHSILARVSKSRFFFTRTLPLRPKTQEKKNLRVIPLLHCHYLHLRHSLDHWTHHKRGTTPTL